MMNASARGKKLVRGLPDFRGLPRPFWVLFAGTLVNRAGGFVLVFLAIYLTEVRGLTAAEAGSIVSVYGLGAIGGAPLGGALSDRWGRRPTLVASLIGGGASMVALGFVDAVPAMIVTALVTGLLYEMYRPVVSATIADIVGADDRPRAYSLLYWAVNLGASVAPPVGGYLAATSYPVLFVADGATTAMYGVMLWLALPETRPSGSVRGSEGHAQRAILRDRLFLTICLLTFALNVVFFQAFVGLPIDMRAHGISTAAFGGLMAINPVLIVLLQPWAGELIRDRPRATILALASLLIGLGFGMNAYAGSPPAYAGCIVVFTLGEILFAPAAVSLVADLAPAHLRGRYQGTFAVAFTAAFAAAPVIGGFVMTAAGARWLWMACLITGGGVSAGFLLLRATASPRP
jgi:MFS family permease